MQDLGIDKLSPANRLELLGEIWDSLALTEMPIPESHLIELECRLAAADADPMAGETWEEVKKRLRSKR